MEPTTTSEYSDSFEAARSSIDYLWRHLYYGVSHDVGTGDFATYLVSLPAAWWVTAVMQTGTPDMLRRFLAGGHFEKVAVLRDCLQRSTDTSLFVTVPTTQVDVEASSVAVLAVKDEAGVDHIVAVGEVMSTPVSVVVVRVAAAWCVRHSDTISPHRSPKAATSCCGTRA